jgi:FMN phosphatase YigB (HAD superfamily)
MSRPLIVSDCDEVLLYMVAPFRDWLAEQHGVVFDMAGGDFARAMRRADSDVPLEPDEIWRLLNLFFDGEMRRQSPVPGVIDAIAALREHADVVVLTNLKDFRQEARTRQLLEHGLDLRVFTNQGPKGPALKAILDEYAPSRAIFIDDLAQHHGSAAELVPHVGRLHLCAEPMLAPHIDCAHRSGHAHARIDDWASALPWLIERLYAEETA